ncbi:MAG TPA: hypothetical protein VNJ03_17010 [Vicinamibacterales bacterium]|nr:hypothetical protein [Vicinamibacterales bacterium]
MTTGPERTARPRSRANLERGLYNLADAIKLTKLTRTQIQHMARFGAVKPAKESHGTGDAMGFDKDNLRALKLGGELMRLGYSGMLLTRTMSWVTKHQDWPKVADPTQRQAVAFVVLVFIHQHEDGGIEAIAQFQSSPAVDTTFFWTPSVTIIALGGLIAELDTAINEGIGVDDPAV